MYVDDLEASSGSLTKNDNNTWSFISEIIGKVDLSYSVNDNYGGFINASQSFFNGSYYKTDEGYGHVSAEGAFERLLGFDIESRDDFGGNLWGLDNIGAREVWSGTGSFSGVTGKDITVAVVDTGIDYSHPEFANRIVEGYDFVNNRIWAHDGHGHGTHVAGTIAGANDGIGITGVAYDSKIMPIKVLSDSGWGTWNAVINGIKFAADKGADIINLSLGGSSHYQPLADAVKYANDLGSVVVMASGNSGSSDPGYPARYAVDNGIAVGAAFSNKEMTWFSNRSGSTKIDYVTAPGYSIYSALPNNSYSWWSGTSMASPHVAGVAALLRSYDDSLSTKRIEQLITSTSVHREQTSSNYSPSDKNFVNLSIKDYV